MRGLKRLPSTIDARTLKSHLLQMRGLKHKSSLGPDGFVDVASFTDAWIETSKISTCGRETMSHLLQMRGLKLFTEPEHTHISVASFTDAWIETG